MLLSWTGHHAQAINPQCPNQCPNPDRNQQARLRAQPLALS